MLELRTIEGKFIGSVDGIACEDPVFYNEQGGFVPYKAEDEFNAGLARAMKLEDEFEKVWTNHVAKLVRVMPPHRIVLAHADISPRNIIVRGDQAVWIVDWEMAGFYPEYWEYIKSMYQPNWQSK